LGITAPIEWTSVEELCRHYLGGLPSASVLPILAPLAQEPDEVRRYTERTFRLMNLSRFDYHDFSPMMAWWLGAIIPRNLPCAWGNVVPSITMVGRHGRIDDYLAANPYAALGAGTRMLDIGCGFPPYTSMDTARRFPDWNIVGADPCFDPYLIYSDPDTYACADEEGRIRYFQTESRNPAVWEELRDRDASIARFTSIFHRLKSRLPEDEDGQPSTVEDERASLVRRPLRKFELPNLRLMKAGFGADALPKSDVIRAFNVLIYFDAQFRRDSEAWVAKTLESDGLFVCGMDAPWTFEARYTVSRKENGGLVEKEFAFGLDNVRPGSGLPWFTLHDNDRETWRLATAVGTIRADEAYRREFGASLDRLYEARGVMVRTADGYLGSGASQMTIEDWPAMHKGIYKALDEQGFLDRAISLLNDAGLRAWRNEIGHIAVDPRGLSV
jgi:hypothetical protein